MRPTQSLTVLCLTACLLASCATHSSPIPSVEPVRPPPADCTHPRAEPVIPDGAGLERPLDTANAEAMSVFLNWVSDALEWGRELARAQQTRASSKDCTR